MGRPNKGSSLTEKAFDNYSASDYLAGFENGGSTHKYNIANVSKYALEKQTLSAGGKSGTVKTIIDGLTPRIKKTEDDIAAFETTVAQAEAAVTELSGRVNAMESGPLVAATSSAMVDTTRIYVYTGEELGMTSGNWYYHNGTNWVSGGAYNAVAVNTDNTLSVEDVPADAKAVGDALEEMDEQKANVDGVYESMTVGNAEQLIGSVFTEDSIPYNFRTAGGSIDIGDREIDKLVGGTIAWNQLVEDGNFQESPTQWLPNNIHSIINVSNGVATVTTDGVTELNPYTPAIRLIPAGHLNHVYFVDIDAKTEVSTTLYFGANSGVFNNKFPTVANEWTENEVLVKATALNTAGTLFNYIGQTSGAPYGENIYFRKIQIIDLTQMFGSTIADYIYSLEQATAGAGVAFFRKLFPKPYYPYNAGELMSVETSAHVTRGFNAWDEEWELGGVASGNGKPYDSTTQIRSKNYIHIVPLVPYCFTFKPNDTVTSERICVLRYDENKQYIGYEWYGSNHTTIRTFPENCHYIRLCFNAEYGTFYNNDICINLSWDGERDGEYEEYKEHVYPLDSNLTLRGFPKLDASNKLYYDGDTYESDGRVVRKYGIVDLGTLEWTKQTSAVKPYFRTSSEVSDMKKADATQYVEPIICSKYPANSWGNVCDVDGIDKAVGVGWNNKSYIAIADSEYTDPAAFKSAMSGVYVVYELAEPTEETAAPYQNPQVVDDFGTEEYVDSRVVPIPVGHETKYANNLRAKLEMAPDSPDGNGDYIVRHTNGENEYTPLVIPKELPNTPSEDGIYHLKVTVVNGAAGLSWESEA